MVHGILLARVPPRDAEDLVQDVFISAMRQLRGLRTAAAFRGWLAAIARNRAIDYFRDAMAQRAARRRHRAAARRAPGGPGRVRGPGPDPQPAGSLPGDAHPAAGGGHDGAGDRATDGPDARFRAGQPVPRHEDVAGSMGRRRKQ